ncbi:ribonuclease H-like domain-containing protein [Tanacetum coccineum]
MCDKKNNVLFTDTACVVLSPDFKLTDESHVLLKAPRKDNMYSIDLKNIISQGGLTCLFAKATPDESNLWHRRLGHVNFKTMNKLVKGSLVKGLPSKLFEINQTCVACQKGKQHRASCIENLIDLKVKVIRCDNRTEFKNRVMNQFCEMKGIKREFSVVRTPQQNRVVERKNRTPIEAARTMLADSKLPTTFWAGAVNIACYVQNRVLVIKPHNKTPYELFLGRKPALNFMRPFGCPITILNTIDHLGSGLNWLFDIDTLTKSMNYKPVVAGNQSNGSTGIKACDNVIKARMETIPGKDYTLLPLSIQDLPFSSSSKDSPNAGFKPSRKEEKKDAEDPKNKSGNPTEGKDSEVPSTKEPKINQEKVGRTARIESFENEGLGDEEDASNQERKITDIDVNKEVTLIDETQGRNDDNLIATTTTVDEFTLAQTLLEIKAAKPKAVTTTATTTITAVSRPKARGVVVQEPSEFTITTSPSQPSQLPQAKDKGKAKMVEPEKPLKQKDQILIDEEIAQRLQEELQAELEEEERLTRQKEQDANIAEWDNVQAIMDADYELATRLQAQEQEELTIEEGSKMFMELMDKRKKHFARLREK